jgi:transmembrane sensor
MDNVKEFPNIDQIKDEAAAWVGKVHGQTYKTGNPISDDLVAELSAWLAQSDVHRDCFLKTLSSWEAMGMLEVLADILPLAHSPQHQQAVSSETQKYQGNRLDYSVISRSMSRVLSGAVAMICVVLIGVILFVELPPSEYKTVIGEQARYSLADGSTITLNTNSEVRIDYSDTRRVVTLVRGEANFDVAKDMTRPFMVYAGDGMVRAVGTAFNVRYKEGYVDVTVSEGRVKVFSDIVQQDLEAAQSKSVSVGVAVSISPPKSAESGSREGLREVVLDAGETAQYKKSIIVREPVEQKNIHKKLAWKTGALVFEGETLEEAIKEISRYTDLELVIADPSLSNTHVGGRFKTDDIDQLLNSLARGLNIKAEKGEGNQIIFLAK